MLRACAAAAACRRAGAPPPPPRAQLPSSRDAYARPRPAPPPPGWRNGWRHGRRRVTGDQGQIVLQGSTQLPVPITLMPHTHTHLALPQRAPQPLGVCRGACVESKQAQPSASWRSGGCFQRQGRPQAAPSFGQPRPISRFGGAGPQAKSGSLSAQGGAARVLRHALAAAGVSGGVRVREQRLVRLRVGG